MQRKNPLVVGEYYHVFNKSIAKFRIFNTEQEYTRMLYVIRYYQWRKIPVCFSHFCRLPQVEHSGIDHSLTCLSQENRKLVEIIAYCLMPTHLHLIVKQLADKGISTFMGNILNSYARYFNTTHKRLGPLWAGRFKAVLIETNEQMLHLTRYLHLNPTTAGLVKNPAIWPYSSCREYLNNTGGCFKISGRDSSIDLPSKDYKRFMDDQIGYQKKLGLIRKLIVE